MYVYKVYIPVELVMAVLFTAQLSLSKQGQDRSRSRFSRSCLHNFYNIAFFNNLSQIFVCNFCFFFNRKENGLKLQNKRYMIINLLILDINITPVDT